MSRRPAIPSPAIAVLREADAFLRGVAALTCLAFAMLILAPSVAAARAASEQPRGAPAAPRGASDEAAFSRALQRIEVRLADLAERLGAGAETATDLDDLSHLQAELDRLDAPVSAGFERVARMLSERALPEEIRRRHQAAVAAYRERLQALRGDLDAVETSTDARRRAEHLRQARERLRAHPSHRAHQPFDPGNLPTRALEPDAHNRPRLDPAAFRRAGLFDTPYPTLAALGTFRIDTLPGANDPAFLAESDEVVLSDAVRAKAAALDHDPVAIFEWVRNHIAWDPGWGAVQAADLTLGAGRGNAMDIASLLIALLRASGIPARYVHGTIELPEARFRNWAGGFGDIAAAADFAASTGMPVATVISAGRIEAIRIEHVWVEAAIDFTPSRGAVNRAADTWVPLDASFKQYAYQPGLDVIAIAGIDPEALAEAFLASGQLDEQAGWVSGLDPTILRAAQDEAQAKLDEYIAESLPEPTIGDVIGGRRTIVESHPGLAGSLPYRVLVRGARYDHLPSSLQQRITWSLCGSASVTLPYARINNRRVTLSFRPASAADEQTLMSLLPEGEITDISQLPERIPAYLIRVVPELRLAGELLGEGASQTLGSDMALTSHVQYPGIDVPAYTQNLIAGSYLVVNSVAGNVSAAVLEALRGRLQATKATLESADQTAIAALAREDLLGEIFHAGSLGYFAQLIALAHIAGMQMGGHYRVAAGLGTLGYEPNVTTFFGIPRTIEPGGVSLDIPIQQVSAVDSGEHEGYRRFNLQVGVLSSALEHVVPEQMFVSDENPGEAISAVKALQKASQQGQRVYHITEANADSALANIHHDAATMAEIRDALAVGKEVITDTESVSVPGWSGAGYVILDPNTGIGAWKIAGASNGSALWAGFLGLLLFPFFLWPAMVVAALIGAELGLSLIGCAGLALIAELLLSIQYFNLDYDFCFGVTVASTAGTVAAGPFIDASGLLGYVGWMVAAMLALWAFFGCG